MPFITRKFQNVAQRQDPTVFNFKHEARQALHDFPQLKKQVIFLAFHDTSSGAKPVYPALGIKSMKIRKLIGEHTESEQYKNTSFRWLKDGIRFMFLRTEKPLRPKLAKSSPAAQEIAFIFDHEFMHTMFRGHENKAECIADAYAVIRHFQRYGVNSPVIDAIVANRAFDFVFREEPYGRYHFTSPVTEEILARRYEANWDSLTPEQTVQVALAFVQSHRLNIKTRDGLEKRFRQFHDTAESIANGDIAPLQALAEKVLSTRSYTLFRYGAAALEAGMDRQAAGNQECWDDVRQKLTERRKEFVRRGYIRLQPRPVKCTLSQLNSLRF